MTAEQEQGQRAGTEEHASEEHCRQGQAGTLRVCPRCDQEYHV